MGQLPREDWQSPAQAWLPQVTEEDLGHPATVRVQEYEANGALRASGQVERGQGKASLTQEAEAMVRGLGETRY